MVNASGENTLLDRFLVRISFGTLEMTDKTRRSLILNSLDLANFYLALGEKDAAIDALEKAYDERSSDLRSLKVDPRFEPMRDNERFRQVYRKIGFLES